MQSELLPQLRISHLRGIDVGDSVLIHFLTSAEFPYEMYDRVQPTLEFGGARGFHLTIFGVENFKIPTFPTDKGVVWRCCSPLRLTTANKVTREEY